MSAAPLHPIDRRGAALQKARLHARRMRRCAALSVEAGDVPAARRAMARVRAAEAREARASRRYATAVLDAYCGPAPAVIPVPACLSPGLAMAGSVADGQ